MTFYKIYYVYAIVYGSYGALNKDVVSENEGFLSSNFESEKLLKPHSEGKQKDTDLYVSRAKREMASCACAAV